MILAYIACLSIGLSQLLQQWDMEISQELTTTRESSAPLSWLLASFCLMWRKDNLVA